jgi:PhnB protein
MKTCYFSHTKSRQEPMDIKPYLTFNGNCREAMTFYQECLGGELSFQTVGESPLAELMPATMKDCIVHASLTSGNLVLLASDMVTKNGLLKGNAVAIMLSCSTEEETRACYARLSQGGKKSHSLEHTFWGALFGDLTDRYGIQWLLSSVV